MFSVFLLDTLGTCCIAPWEFFGLLYRLIGLSMSMLLREQVTTILTLWFLLYNIQSLIMQCLLGNLGS